MGGAGVVSRRRYRPLSNPAATLKGDRRKRGCGAFNAPGKGIRYREETLRESSRFLYSFSILVFDIIARSNVYESSVSVCAIFSSRILPRSCASEKTSRDENATDEKFGTQRRLRESAISCDFN